jgi:hypothetical protein
LFKRLAEPDVADLGVANQQLNTGLLGISDEVLRVYGKVLPESEYTVLLLDITPRLVGPGTALDYLTHEQVATWGVDGLSGAGDDPGTPYYRTFEAPVGAGSHLYEFVVPMVPPSWNNAEWVGDYVAAGMGATGTAVAYSILDLLQPAVDEGEDYYEHWVLTHFLLDGHHKIEAAARAERPIRLLSLVDDRISIAGTEDLATLVQARSQAREPRAW